jgi:hypothetical protein
MKIVCIARVRKAVALVEPPPETFSSLLTLLVNKVSVLCLFSVLNLFIFALVDLVLLLFVVSARNH